MKKLIILLLCFGVMSVVRAELKLVDDFESFYISQKLDNGEPCQGAAGGTWDQESNTTSMVKVEGANPGNQFFRAWGSSGSDHRGGGFTGVDDLIMNAETGTAFVRFYIVEEARKVLAYIGSHDMIGADFLVNATCVSGSINAGFELYRGATNGTMEIRTIGGATTLKTGLALDTWYNAWIIADNATDTFELYINTASGPGEALSKPAEADKIADGLAFSKATTNPLQGLMFCQSEGVDGAAHAEIRIDDPHWDGSQGIYAPTAWNPDPKDKESEVAVDKVLQWSAPDDPNVLPAYTQYAVYLDPNETKVASGLGCQYNRPMGSSNTYDPAGDLAYDETYYWRVETKVQFDDKTDPNTIANTVWSFSTKKSLPGITGPTDLIVAEGDLAQLQVSVSSISPIISYVWWKSADNVVDYAAGDEMVSGAETDTLYIDPTDGDDEAYYYCVVTNQGGSSTSSVAKLGVKRRVAYWSLDSLVGGQYDDGSGEGHHADPNGTPVPVTGVVNDGMTIDAVSGWANAGTWDPTYITGELTVCGWVKWNGGASSQNILAKRDGWDETQMMWQFGTSSSGLLKLQCADRDTVSTAALRSGEWTFVAASFDGTNATVYQVDEDNINFISQTGAFELGLKTDAVFLIGCSDTTGAEYFDGALDEIQVFNYAMDAKGIADLYNQVGDKAFCLDPYPAAFDYDSNCKIDLGDLAALAQEWLKSGLYYSN